MSRRFFGNGKPRSDLNTIGAQSHCCKYCLAGSNASGSHQGQRTHFTNRRNQSHCRSFFASVVATGFKTFGHNGIHSRLFAFQRKSRAGNYVGYNNALLFQPCSKFLRTTGRSKNDRHLFFSNNIQNGFQFRIKQWNIYSKGLISG